MANSSFGFWKFLEFFSKIFLIPRWLNLQMQNLRYRGPTVLVIEGLTHTRYCLGAFTYIVSFNQDNTHVNCVISVIILILQARKLRLTGSAAHICCLESNLDLLESKQ